MFNIKLSFLNKRGASIDDIKQLKKGLKVAFNKIKKEFSEHLESINQNTNEIQNNYEFLCELESKMEKLSQRVDEIQMFFSHNGQTTDSKQVPKTELTEKEREVFMVLYTNENSLLSYSDIADRLGIDELLVRNYISNLLKKGIPVMRKEVDNKIVLALDPDFKRLQAKENVLKVNETQAKLFA